MEDLLELPVQYNNEDLLFSMEMVRWGYTHRFRVTIDGMDYFFEPDDEGNYRAIAEDAGKYTSSNIALLKAISETLGELMR